MANPWYRVLHRFCNGLYFSRISVLWPERLPRTGPTIYLGLHRNGAVDGFIYHAILPRANFMISTQLRRNLIGRLFFTGIEVARDRDEGEPGTNLEALNQCMELLRMGGELVIFPEGTSTLGPRHLPFKSGAVRILANYLESGSPIQVVPLGITYECPWAFRSRVEVVVGAPVATDLSDALHPLGRLKELKRSIQSALESVGVNVESEQYQQMIHRLACVATLGTKRSYFKTLKALEQSIPEKILLDWRALRPEIEKRKLWHHQGVPLFPAGPAWRYLLALGATGPLVGLGALLNLPPLLGAWWAGKKFPDGPNVISLWRVLVGAPLFLLWVAVMAMVAIVSGRWPWFGLYALTTFSGLKLYYRVKKLAVAVHNGLRYPELRPQVLAFRETVLRETFREPAPLTPSLSPSEGERVPEGRVRGWFMVPRRGWKTMGTLHDD
ncbi:MAG: hypothetical protein DME23_02115 [Verrucomicrobia bacterium]|nr:MAG: hypothetical protein DME23_02115 [Verrucomicrobiota bacterium]